MTISAQVLAAQRCSFACIFESAMKKQLLFFFLLPAFAAHAQMWNDTDTLYGNEWIDFSKTYYKIKVTQDGIYRIGYQTLVSAGFPSGSVPANQLRLYRNGIQEPVFTSTDGIFGNQDYLEFYGRKNRDEIDKYLFENPAEENLNPWYNLFNDTSAYFLTWETSGEALRYNAVPNDLNNLPPKTEFCWQQLQQIYNQSFAKRRRSEEITFSWFEGEGFCRAPSTQTVVALTPKKLHAAGPPASVTVRYACQGGQHQQRITVNDTIFAEDAFSEWKIVERTFPVPLTLIQTNASVKVQSLLGGTDRNAVAGVSLRYPRQFDFENAAFAAFELDSSNTEQYLEIQFFNTSGGAPLLFDLTNKMRLETIVEGGVAKVKLPPSASARQLVLVAPAAIINISQIAPVQFRDYRTENADYVILSNPVLYSDPASGGANHVAEFAAYRESPEGGNRKVAIADINELYEQFAYGIRFHPIAVRNFLHYADKHWPDLRHVFIIGKGLDYSQFRTSAAQASLADSLFFVPAFGTPAADGPFVLTGNRLSKPIAALGRLAVTTPSEIKVYLEKVKSHELTQQTAAQTIEGKAWMKRVIHNSGGQAGETAVIRTYTSDMANVLANNRFGADVHTFYKTSNDPIQLSSYKQMLDLIDGGVSLWTIYGHSSAFAVDFDIGAPNAYNNSGRYPLLMIMGCFSGLCSSPQQGIGEQFILAPDRGAIAYIASVNYSYITALHDYGRKYYELLGGTDFGKSVGEVLQNTIGELQGTNYDGLIAVLHQNLLQGDPAIKIFAQEGPDYLIDNQSVKFDPNPVGLQQNAFKLNFDLANIGENTGGQIALKIEQRLPDNTVLSRIADTVPVPPYRSPLSYDLPVAGSKIGFNRFFITVDPDNQIAEKPFAAELNNELTDAAGERGVDVYFYSDDVQAIYPPAYGIVRNPELTLRASTLNTNAAPLRYLFELDTLETFDTPFKKNGQVFQRGGLLEWNPGISLKDSTVYYWRVARDSLVNGVVVWRTRSFIYLPGSPGDGGWNQSDFGQYRDGVFSNVQAVDSTRRLEFQNNTSTVIVKVAYRGVNRYPGVYNLFYDGVLGDYTWGIQGVDDGVVLSLSDPNTGRFVLNPANGPYNHAPQQDRLFFLFSTRDSLKRVKLMDFLSEEVPDNYIVSLLAFSRPWDTLGYAPQHWARDSVTYGKNLFQILESHGAKKVRKLADFTGAPYPYGLIYRHNAPGFPVQDTIVYDPDSTYSIRADFLAKWTSGLMESPVIGPVKQWKSLHWRREDFDDPSDQAAMELLAVREGLPDTLLMNLKNTFDTTLVNIPAAEFPNLKLRYSAGDTLLRTLSQPVFIRLLFDAIPEGALHPAAKYEFYRDTLQRGETLKTAVAFTNVSDAPMDSLLVKFRIEPGANNGTEVLKKFRPLPAGDTLVADFSEKTIGLDGPQRLIIDVNPNNAQPELYHFNNVSVQDFYVARDNRNPLLDVTFDGMHILDGDVVSPKPEIVITLKDDNRFLAMTDTGTFSLLLELPGGAVQPIAFNDPAVLFIPADGTDLPHKNQARLEWRPTFTYDGDYRLLVNGHDASGNESASLDYSVAFKVITKSSLSNILNYPNPFSTRTCFVYTMTGAESPAHFKIQIMTVAGRVVREITETEFGPLRAGTHQSDFCWDGKDEYGDQLANGVYLYRIVAKKSDGSNFDLFENNGVDGFFKHGFGKMVLMR